MTMRKIACDDPLSVQFPYQDEIATGESGQGYALRMASGNGLRSVVILKKLLGKKHSMAFEARDAPYLAHWLGATEQRLAFALEQIPRGTRSSGCSYAGHWLGRSYFLVRSCPRVCPDCIQDLGYCRMAWDLALCVACVRHQRVLVETCPLCARALSWNRPALNSCACGYFWEESVKVTQPSNDELVIARAIDLQMPDGNSCGSNEKLAHSSNSWHSLFQHLTLDGLMRIVHALAIASAHDYSSSAEPRVRRALPKARQTIRIAAAFGKKVAALESISLRTHRPIALIDLLCDLVATPSDARKGDLSTAQSMLRWLLSNSPRSTLRCSHQPLAQQVLL